MVPRVTMLDALVLDDHITKVFIDQTFKALRFFPSWIINNLNAEINASLELLLSYYSIKNSKATFGQQLLGVKYNSDQLSNKKIVLLHFFTIGASYISSKLDNPSKNFINKISYLENISSILKFFSFLNFLLFLHQGKYPILAQRLLGLSQESTRRRVIGYEYMTRELLWHGFSELLLFTLPLINYQSMKHKVGRIIYSQSKDSTKYIEKTPILNARTVCSICQDKPIIPHHIKCSHVFCFYCINSMRLVDDKFECPECFHYEKDILPVIIN
ncbi:peroxisome biogenesis factor 2 [Daktulosphaira vitifoliae]|uniref:peroxisome biogenesis factor 2 n=1 Tax=Daktulosphaira vitifoliae TaxID=58002 RepID=UPI0021A98957|nr:peroxisome biogenesis factor 2 [Daktulosphaira vitifoliae]